MHCPFCNHLETKVIDSRDTQEGRAIRRRRECEKCQARFSTYEEVEIFRLLVVKKDGRREEYDRSKIEKGLERAFEKRPAAEEKLIVSWAKWNMRCMRSVSARSPVVRSAAS